MVNRRDFGKISLAAGLAATMGRSAWAASAADTAVKAARQYKGRSITIVWEAGLQSLDPTHFSGPKWKELTGMDVKVIEVATAEMFTKIMQDYKSGAGAYDALNVIPAWMPDLAQAGALEVLDPYVEKYGYAPELQTIASTFRDNQMKVGGKIYGFPDDGDVFLMYYRRDIFEDPTVQKAFKDKTGKDLAVPKTWADFGVVENLAAFLQGQSAMTISWPPYGRWAEGYGADQEALNWVPKTTIAGKVGYALPPGGHPELAAGFALSISSTSKNKDAAYLFIQWLNSEDVSRQRVQLPYTLRDPFRDSHYADPGYLALWPNAKDYLVALKQASQTGLLDLSLLQTDKYEEIMRQAISKLWAGDDPKTILDAAAAQWDNITQKIGVDKQKVVYAGWAAKSGAYPKM